MNMIMTEFVTVEIIIPNVVLIFKLRCCLIFVAAPIIKSIECCIEFAIVIIAIIDYYFK